VGSYRWFRDSKILCIEHYRRPTASDLDSIRPFHGNVEELHGSYTPGEIIECLERMLFTRPRRRLIEIDAQVRDYLVGALRRRRA